MGKIIRGIEIKAYSRSTDNSTAIMVIPAFFRMAETIKLSSCRLIRLKDSKAGFRIKHVQDGEHQSRQPACNEPNNLKVHQRILEQSGLCPMCHKPDVSKTEGQAEG